MAQTIQGRLSNGTYGTVAVGDGGQLLLSASSLSQGIYTLPFDYVGAAYPNATTEVYTTRVGGASGSIQEVVTVTYSDSSKENLVSIGRS